MWSILFPFLTCDIFVICIIQQFSIEHNMRLVFVGDILDAKQMMDQIGEGGVPFRSVQFLSDLYFLCT